MPSYVAVMQMSSFSGSKFRHDPVVDVKTHGLCAESSAARGPQDAVYLEPAKGRIMTAEECRRFHPHHGAQVDGPQHVWIESLRIAMVSLLLVDQQLHDELEAARTGRKLVCSLMIPWLSVL